MDDWTQLLMRFAHYVLLLGLFGQTAFGSFGLRGVVTDRTVLASDAIVVLAAMAPLVSTALLLTSIAAMMGQPLWSLDQEVVEIIVMTTGIGLAFVIRLALLVAALIALILRPHFPAMLICPRPSGPSTMIVWITGGTRNAEQEAQAGRDHRQVA